jgi:hypothetical protein
MEDLGQDLSQNGTDLGNFAPGANAHYRLRLHFLDFDFVGHGILL